MKKSNNADIDENHKNYHKRLFSIVFIMLILLFGGATFYHLVEKWRYLDSVYFATETMTTIGYGDFTPKTDIGKIFTIFFAFTSVGIALYGLSIIAAHFIEAREELWLQRLGNTKLRKHTSNIFGRMKKILNFDSSKIIKSGKK